MAKSEGAVLVMRFSALGDVAIALPTVYEACSLQPDRHFVFLTRRRAAEMFVNAPANLTVIGLGEEDIKGINALRRLFRRLDREYHFSAVADLHDVLRSKVLRLCAMLGGVSPRSVAHIRKGRKEKRALTRRNRKVLSQLKSSEQRYRDTFARLGIATGSGFASLFGPDGADYALFAAASEPMKPGQRWIGIAPFARHPGKIYPPQKMQEVVKALASRPGVRIFLFGAGEEERMIMEQWKGAGDVVNVAACKLTLPQELALMSALDVMVSMDSANMHLASLVGTRTVSIWGATHPFTGFMGHGQKEDDAIQLGLPCRPCSVFGQKPCRRGDYYCLTGILPAQILQAIDKE